MQRTKIEWATHTWSPAVGCSKVSAGCANCYAEAMVYRFPWMTGTDTAVTGLDGDDISINTNDGWDGNAHFKPERLKEPFHLRAGKDRPHRIFACSMSDLFHESLTNEQIASVFGAMAATPQHQYVVLTKRLRRAMEWFRWTHKQGALVPSLIGVDIPYGASGEAAACAMSVTTVHGPMPTEQHVIATHRPWPLTNVIICASVEDQHSADERVPLLLQIPAAYHGVSVEPMLELVDFTSLPFGKMGNRILNAFTAGSKSETPWGLDLVICGAETGPGKRRFDDEWASDLRDQCKEAGVPFFFKKDGAGNRTLCGVEYHEWIGG